MVLPLLMSIGLPALAGTGALAGVPLLGTMGAAGLAGIGAGLGSFLQTGDIGKGIQTGLTSFLGGKVLGGLTGGAGMKDGTAMERILGSQASAREAALESIKQAGGTGFIGGLPTGTEGSLFSGGLQGAAAGAMLPGVLSAGLNGMQECLCHARRQGIEPVGTIQCYPRHASIHGEKQFVSHEEIP